jgi:hypothetical protein
MTDERYGFSEDKIVHEVLDGEVVLVNLDNGYYYILQGTGSVIWQTLTGGATVVETVEALLSQYTGARAEVEQAVKDFVNDLKQESLLHAAEGRAARNNAPTSAEPSGTPFTVPVMFRYTDMANLIQMDPIREYDETGWPSKRTTAPRARP